MATRPCSTQQPPSPLRAGCALPQARPSQTQQSASTLSRATAMRRRRPRGAACARAAHRQHCPPPLRWGRGRAEGKHRRPRDRHLHCAASRSYTTAAAARGRVAEEHAHSGVSTQSGTAHGEEGRAPRTSISDWRWRRKSGSKRRRMSVHCRAGSGGSAPSAPLRDASKSSWKRATRLYLTCTCHECVAVCTVIGYRTYLRGRSGLRRGVALKSDDATAVAGSTRYGVPTVMEPTASRAGLEGSCESISQR